MLEYSMLYPRTTTVRRSVSLDGMWKIRFDEKQVGCEEKWTDGLSNADWIPVPASFQDFYTDKDIREYTGDFWYEKEFFVPGEWNGMEVGLRFGSATHFAEVYVNGVLVFTHKGGFLPFFVRITDVVRYNVLNKVVVRINNELSVTNIPCGVTKTLKNGKKMAKPYFDFYNYSGLNRSIYLTAIPKESILDYTVVHELVQKDAKVHYNIKTNSEHPVKVSLFDEEGKKVAESEGKDGILYVSQAHLWQVRNAYLYHILIQIFDGDRILDEYGEDIGIRTVEIEGTDILINGSPVYLKGFGKHEDSDIVGRGYQPAVMKRDFECMKWIGANSFRTSHYPYSEEMYQMADREGFLVIDEVPAVGLFESTMNFFEAMSGKRTVFFEKPTTGELLENHLQQIEEMITRDKNHACVFAWSLLNEPETTDPSAVPYFEKLFQKAHELDKQKRPRTFAMIMNSLPNTCKCYSFSDFLCLNRYYGWYDRGGYEICDAEEGFRQELDEWKAKNLNKPFVFTEYGADTNPSMHKLPSVMWSQEYQIEYLEMCHRVFDSYDFIKGEQVWNFADFQTTEGIMRMDGNKKGIFTRQRQPKEAAFYFKKRWESLPLDYKG